MTTAAHTQKFPLVYERLRSLRSLRGNGEGNRTLVLPFRIPTSPKILSPDFEKLLEFRPLYFEGPLSRFFFAKIKIKNRKSRPRGDYSPIASPLGSAPSAHSLRSECLLLFNVFSETRIVHLQYLSGGAEALLSKNFILSK